MRIYLFIAFLFFSSILNSQEILSTLVSNPILNKEELLLNKNKIALSLPFFDDFSNDSNSVNIVLWEKSSVFINRTYPINPITLGVATFDGLDENGFARNFFQTNPSVPSDTLLSKKIDLSAVDSAYLMFYFQGKGVGDSPQLNDSLVLEFFSNTLVWEQIWFSFGQSMQEFDKVIQIINNY